LRIVRDFTLEPLPPFRLDLTAWALRRRPHNAVDRWDGDTYRRALRLSGGVAEIEVRQVGPCDAPELEVLIAAEEILPGTQADVTGMLQRMLGLDVDLHDFYRRAAGDLHLRPLVERFQGLKPPRFPSVFECLVNAIACQQLTLTVGIGLLNRLAEGYGPATAAAGTIPAPAFPDPRDLSTADPDTVRKLGFSTAKARAVVELAQRISEGSPDLERLAGVDDDAAAATLQELRGIGRWSAEYALLRGLGRLAIFPADDVGARNNLQRLLGVDTGMDAEAVRRAVVPWAPYAGLVYFHLLLDRVDRAGLLAPVGPEGEGGSAGGVRKSSQSRVR
jgi:DNA-3-methyladenine glycosylase II